MGLKVEIACQKCGDVHFYASHRHKQIASNSVVMATQYVGTELRCIGCGTIYKPELADERLVDGDTTDRAPEKFNGLNDYRDRCHENACNKGFHDEKQPLSTLIMLVVTELAEAVEGDRKGNWENVKEEISDALIRIFDISGLYKIDLDHEVQKKMAYNKTRTYKHGKKY